MSSINFSPSLSPRKVSQATNQSAAVSNDNIPTGSIESGRKLSNDSKGSLHENPPSIESTPKELTRKVSSKEVLNPNAATLPNGSSKSLTRNPSAMSLSEKNVFDSGAVSMKSSLALPVGLPGSQKSDPKKRRRTSVSFGEPQKPESIQVS